VTVASSGVLAEFEARGFCVLPGVVPVCQIAGIRAAYDRWFAAATAPDLRTSRSGGDTRLIDLVTRGRELDGLYLLEPVLEAARATIGEGFKLSSFGGRTVTAGAAAQTLHVDVTPEQDAWPLLGFIVMVDEFRADNGATRFVPGSHRTEISARAWQGHHRPDAEPQALACGEAGSVIVYVGSVWHGYSANRSRSPRRSIQGAYIPRSGTGAVQWSARLTPGARRRLSPAAKHLLAAE
jgi:hypothetical protein